MKFFLILPVLMVSMTLLPIATASEDVPQNWLKGLRVVRIETKDTYSNPEAMLDARPDTTCVFKHDPNTAGDIDAGVIIDLGRPSVVQAVRVTNGKIDPIRWVTEIAVSPDAKHFRPLLCRSINLPMQRGGDSLQIDVEPAAGRYLRIGLGGVKKGQLGEIQVMGYENRPERHMLCWAGDIQKDYLDKLDYLDKGIGVTDLWIDFFQGAFPESIPHSSFEAWIDSGALEQFKQRGIRYWLSEHESFPYLVNSPEDLRDDQKWETTYRQMKKVYSRACALGFRGLVYDSEDYDGVASGVKERYMKKADYVDAWTFYDEFGYSGYYYQRGLQTGKVIKSVWPEATLISLYEARMYAGKPGCRDGNYWWLKGIHDAGVEIWIATEKTYGAGKSEINNPEALEFLIRWFVELPIFLPEAYQAYPFATRVLPGFHPWNTRLKAPMYLPKYLDEQLDLTAKTSLGCWIYTEGNGQAGDPTTTLDPNLCKKYKVDPADYLKIFAKYPTSRSGDSGRKKEISVK